MWEFVAKAALTGVIVALVDTIAERQSGLGLPI